jgi:hypothetical protein
VRGTLDSLRRQLAALEAEPLEGDGQADPAMFDWFAESCPCGLPPGECTTHHRARPGQRLPADDDWLVQFFLMGRAAGKTRAAAEIVHRWARDRPDLLIGLIGPTLPNMRDIMVKGKSGVLRTGAPWSRPTWKPSERRLIWPNGAEAICLSAEETDRIAGFNFSRVWCDELCLWSKPRDAWDQLKLATRDGDVKTVVTSTPRPSNLLAEILASPTTRLSRESTFANQAHLPAEWIDHVKASFGDGRKGQQELFAEIIDVAAGAWFDRFDAKEGGKHVNASAEHNLLLKTYLGIDAGSSRTTAAVLVQFLDRGRGIWRLTVCDDILIKDGQSEKNARTIRAWLDAGPARGILHGAWIDPASEQETPLGNTAFSEYRKVFGDVLDRAPRSDNVPDRLDELEILMDRGDLTLHPGAKHLKASFQNYRREVRGGEPMNKPAKDQSPWEDPMDALRYVVRGRFNDGIAAVPFQGRRVPASHLMGF